MFDKPDQWTDIIDSAPTNHGLYATAMEMVSNRHSKAALVRLVHWLLTERDAALELLREIRDSEVNAEAEADKFLRDHIPSQLSIVTAERDAALARAEAAEAEAKSERGWVNFAYTERAEAYEERDTTQAETARLREALAVTSDIAWQTSTLLLNMILQGYTLPDDKGGCELKRLREDAKAAVLTAEKALEAKP